MLLKLWLISLLLSGSLFANAIGIDVDLSHTAIKSDTKLRVYLRVKLSGTSMEKAHQHTPLNVALVLDRSGSMHGDKLEKTKEAAIAFIDRLHKEDIVSIITYDDKVDILLVASKLSDRKKIIDKIQTIRSGGSTALYNGVMSASKEVEKFLDKERVNRIILLSDGKANSGPSTAEELGALGLILMKKGISVTTLGLGDGYNEDLMSVLASKSDGNHKFLRTSADIKHFFNKELGAISSIAASAITVDIVSDKDIKPIRMLDVAAVIDQNKVTSGFNQIYADHARYMLLELEVPRSQLGRKAVATVTVNYHDMQTKKEQKSVILVSMDVETKSVEYKDVMISVAEQLGAINNVNAMKLRDQGKIKEAKLMLKRNSEMLMQKSKEFNADSLKQQALENTKAMENLNEKRWNQQRKEMLDSQTKRLFKGCL